MVEPKSRRIYILNSHDKDYALWVYRAGNFTPVGGPGVIVMNPSGVKYKIIME